MKSQEEKQLYDTIKDALSFFQSNLHTNLIGRISAVNEKTVDVEPVIARVVGDEVKKITPFTQVPPLFIYGGGSSETWPVSVGDYCVLFVTERAFDYWYSGQDFREPIEPRMHDYSDCLALICAKNKAGALTIPNVITRIGDMFHGGDLEHEGSTTHTGDYELTGNMTINGNLTVNGDVNIAGTLTVPTIVTQNLTAEVGATIGGKSFATHQHTGVQGGSSNTGGVA